MTAAGSPEIGAPDRAAIKRSQATVLAVANYGGIAFSMLAGVVVARALGPTDRGWYGAVVAGSVALALLLSAGSMGLVKFLAGSPKTLHESMAVARRQALRSAAMCGAIVAGCALVLSESAKRTGAVALFGVALVQVVRGYGFAIAGGQGLLSRLATGRALQGPVTAGLMALLWVRSQLTLSTAAIALGLGVLTEGWVYGLAYLRRQDSTGRLDRDRLRQTTSLFAAQLGETFLVRIDLVLVPMLIGGAASGRYAVAVAVSSLPIAYVNALNSRSYALIRSAPDFDNALAHVRRAALSYVVLSGCVALMVPLIPVIYGSDYSESARLALFALMAGLPLGAVYSSSVALQALDLPDLAARMWVVSFLVYLAALVPLALLFGISGVIVANLVGYSTVASFGVLALRARRSGESNG